jgi:hypothetical protein
MARNHEKAVLGVAQIRKHCQEDESYRMLPQQENNFDNKESNRCHAEF